MLRLEGLEGRRMMAAMLYSDADLVFESEPAQFTKIGDWTAPPPVSEPLETFTIPVLNSNPGAPVNIFLDFNGHTERIDTPVGPYFHEIPAFMIDDNPWRFNADEQQAIRDIWTSVAEDFAIFNVNVTTVDPGDLSATSKNLRVAIGGSDFRDDSNAAGFADRHCFTDPDEANIVYVFQINEETGAPRNSKAIAHTVSHETGHAFGLYHQSRFVYTSNGPLRVQEYSTGDGTETSKGPRAPIMGTPSAGNRSIWWYGFNEVGDVQDDIAVLARSANGFFLRPDDHAETILGASKMKLSTKLVASETVGALEGSGIISTTSEKDTFQFETGGGKVTISIAIPAASFGHVSNLRARVLLLDANGGELDAKDVAVGQNLDLFSRPDLAAGKYHVQVMSFGEYGDVGQYTLHVIEDRGARVVNSQFLTHNTSQARLLVTFNEPMNPYSFTASDVRLNGNAPGMGIVDVTPSSDWKQFTITLASGYYNGMTVTVGPDISDQFGNRMDQNQNGMAGEANDYVSALYWARFVDDFFGFDGEYSTFSSTSTRPRTLNRYYSDLAFELY